MASILMVNQQVAISVWREAFAVTLLPHESQWRDANELNKVNMLESEVTDCE